LATAGLAGIRAVHGDNLTVTVAAGTRMAELVGELAARGLEWPVSPWWPEETVGGVVAAGWPVFLEAGYGPLRDQVLGVTLVDGQGVRLRFGRPVVKNVAGYDLTKLAVGSAGRLGVLVELVLRLRPLRALTWRCWAGDGAPTEAAWEALARPDRPFAVVAAPDGLWTGWTRDPGRSWGGEGPDPRMSWRDALEELLAAGAVFADVGRGAPPPPGTRFWWPETGVAVGEFQADAAGVRRRVAWGAWAKASTPAADRLAEAVIRAFDPDAVFSARPEPPRKE
jgi:FAD/FMN-containing dehydrogenase